MRILKAITTAAMALAGVANAQTMDGHAMAQSQHQAQVSQRGEEVMPFSLTATTHFFQKTESGGVQRVVTKAAGDAKQAALIRQHLQDIQAQFRKADFSAPAHIHGHNMPGLAELAAAPSGNIAVEYREVTDGAELSYQTADAKLVEALHTWFDAQLSDHGKDAMPMH